MGNDDQSVARGRRTLISFDTRYISVEADEGGLLINETEESLGKGFYIYCRITYFASEGYNIRTFLRTVGATFSYAVQASRRNSEDRKRTNLSRGRILSQLLRRKASEINEARGTDDEEERSNTHSDFPRFLTAFNLWSWLPPPSEPAIGLAQLTR